jgi:tetratricopeptide (TPR) repeat protein
MLRALRLYRKSGRPERALAVIEHLLPTTTDPRELAALWAERGDILAANEAEKATEAYDMALSYDAESKQALSGLARVLEARGEWSQLLDIYEARSESGAPEERAGALREVARIALERLNDAARAERCLRQVVELAPTREDWEALLGIYGEDPKRKDQRLEAISGLIASGGACMGRLVELGRSLLATGERRWAWCLLSLLMSATVQDQQLKASLLELRKEFEKSDNSTSISAELHASVRLRSAPTALHEVLAELDGLVGVGPASIEEAGAGGAGRIDERTAVGKTFHAIAVRLGLDNAQLTRAQELPAPYLILDGENPQVIVRAELIQLISVAEINFLFTAMLEQTRPGARLISSVGPSGQLADLLGALAGACGLGEAPASAAALVEKIKGGVPADRLAAWAEKLKEVNLLDEAMPMRLLADVVETGRRAGLIAAADLRFAIRILGKLDETLPKMPTLVPVQALDDFIDQAPPVRALIAFATSASCGKNL